RFRYESELLARLHHPGIAQVFEAGTSNGQPYFVMEKVDGVPLTEYARDKRLSIRERVELFAGICDAVHHAHQRGIVHRDLKPDNILVDAKGQAKLLDFGVAKLTDTEFAESVASVESMGTRDGQLVGTLSYMSPEQTRGDPGDVDIRSDVYSLGVILHELLAGSLPYDLLSLSILEVIRTIQERDPARLSSVSAELRGDLETIVLHALEKDPKRRYQSADEFGLDLRRFLSSQAIGARPPSVVYQLSVLARRHRGLVAVSALALVGLVAATIYSTWQRFLADEAAGVAERRAEDAERRLGIAREGADLLLFGLCDGLPRLTGGREIQRDLLEKARAHYEKLAAEAETDVALERGVRQSFRRLGEAYRELGDIERATEASERAHAMIVQAQGLKPENPELKLELCDSWNRLAKLATKRSELSRAESMLESARGLAEELLTLNPNSASYTRRLATAEERLGLVARERKDRDSERRHCDKYLEHAKRLVELSPGNDQYVDHLCLAHDRLGLISTTMADADRHFGRALELARRLVEAEPANAGFLDRLSIALGRVSDLRARQKRGAEAESLLREKSKIAERLVAAEPENPRFAHHLARSYERVAKAARSRGDEEAAFQVLAKAAALLDRATRAEPSTRAYRESLDYVYGDMIEVAIARKETERAAEIAQDRVELREWILRRKPTSRRRRFGLLSAVLARGELLAESNQVAAARRVLERAIPMGEELVR
ncbi:MAG: protein kinase, partial [Planctomycetota bacterium]